MSFFPSLLLSLLISSQAFGWGNIGHRVVAKIAHDSMSSEDQRKLKKIMGNELLEEASNWPDFMRSDPSFDHKAPWHYISIPKGKNLKNCKRSKKGDIVSAIEKYKKQLKSKKSNKTQKREAIAWLTHLVGDIHQPLHTGIADDWGGNKIKLKWFHVPSNLHQIWDEKLIEMQNLSYTEYIKFINHPTKAEIKKWQKASIHTWVDENLAVMDLVYSYPKKQTKYWEYNYFFKTKKLLNKRLVMAGYRLAKVLSNNL